MAGPNRNHTSNGKSPATDFSSNAPSLASTPTLTSASPLQPNSSFTSLPLSSSADNGTASPSSPASGTRPGQTPRRMSLSAFFNKKRDRHGSAGSTEREATMSTTTSSPSSTSTRASLSASLPALTNAPIMTRARGSSTAGTGSFTQAPESPGWEMVEAPLPAATNLATSPSPATHSSLLDRRRPSEPLPFLGSLPNSNSSSSNPSPVPPQPASSNSPPHYNARTHSVTAAPRLPRPARIPSNAPSTASSTDSPPLGSSATARRMMTLPRLLSSNGLSGPYSTASRSGEDEEEQEESDDEETETETETETGTETETEAETEDGELDSPGDGTSPPAPGPQELAPARPRLSASTSISPFAGPTSWVTFDPLTPTPGPLRTARPLPSSSERGSIGYFDLNPHGRGSISGAGTKTPGAGGKTPLGFGGLSGGLKTPGSGSGLLGGGLQSPLLPMSMSNAARGKRPTWEGEADAPPVPPLPPSATSIGTSTTTIESDTTSPPVAVATDYLAINGGAHDGELATTAYRQRSHSAVALMSPSLLDDSGNEVVADTAMGADLDEVWRSIGGSSSPGLRTPGSNVFSLMSPSWFDDKGKAKAGAGGSLASPSLGVSSPAAPSQVHQERSLPNAISPIAAPVQSPRLHRPRSMYELSTAPPLYTPSPHVRVAPVIAPREEEGREPLPSYSCAIHFEGYLPRKMEFTSPGVQAKDRSWKRQWIVLHGTVLRVYKSDLRTHPIQGEESWMTAGHSGFAGIGEGAGEEERSRAAREGPVHFHVGEYGAGVKRSVVEDAKGKVKSGLSGATGNAVIRSYSLQNAESGLAADYQKRKHAVRVRAEGEQFLLLARDDRGVIDLIEALQAATNVSLDLDIRQIPKFITLPRRRRRRRPRPVDGTPPSEAASAETSAGGSSAGGSGGTTGDSESGGRLGDMLAEEQNAYAQGQRNGTVM